MTIEELYRKYAYIKRPLNEVYPDISLVPYEFVLEWFKDTFDHYRIHSDEELKQYLSLTPKEILEWLEEAAKLTWEAKKVLYSEMIDGSQAHEDED